MEYVHPVWDGHIPLFSVLLVQMTFQICRNNSKAGKAARTRFIVFLNGIYTTTTDLQYNTTLSSASGESLFRCVFKIFEFIRELITLSGK